MLAQEERSGLKRLFRPRSIAVIGGGFWCSNVIEQCRKIGFEGDLWSVHPTAGSVGGVPSVSGVQDLPAAPDASFIGINRDATIEALEELAKLGAGGAVCFASGFKEANGETGEGLEKQKALLNAAGATSILGPNCYGFVNYLDGVALWPDQHGGVRVERGVALIMQSSNIAINLTMQARGLLISYVITVGNQAQKGLSDVGLALLDDDRVTAFGLHIEGIDNLEAFERFANLARERGKSIVALKVGKSDAARKATLSHTASLAGSGAGSTALFKRLGIGEVSSLAALFETLKLLHVAGPLSSNRIASMSCSGGEASLIADTAHESRLIFAPLDASQRTALTDALGPNVTLANPLDYHTHIWGDLDAMTATFTAMMRGDLAIGCVVLDFPRGDRCDPSAWDPVIEAVIQAKDATGRPMAILASFSETLPEETASRLIEAGIVPLVGFPEAVEAMEIASDLGQTKACSDPLLLPNPRPSPRTLTEAESKAALAAFGVEVPKAIRTVSVDDAVEAARTIGFPVALKGEGVAHKTEAGAVALNLAHEDAVLDAAKRMPSQVFLVEEMITDTVAELLVGCVVDPAHGYVLTLAAGGTLTELLDDKASVLVPSTRDDVRDALFALKSAVLFSGYRGGAKADTDAILDAVMAVQSYVIAMRPEEIEINPLMYGQNRAVAADALIRIGELNV
ncbi:MAG: acetate--CoA ligase family protein [Pseudomonadota bacterium]